MKKNITLLFSYFLDVCVLFFFSLSFTHIYVHNKIFKFLLTIMLI